MGAKLVVKRWVIGSNRVTAFPVLLRRTGIDKDRLRRISIDKKDRLLNRLHGKGEIGFLFLQFR